MDNQTRLWKPSLLCGGFRHVAVTLPWLPMKRSPPTWSPNQCIDFWRPSFFSKESVWCLWQPLTDTRLTLRSTETILQLLVGHHALQLTRKVTQFNSFCTQEGRFRPFNVLLSLKWGISLLGSVVYGFPIGEGVGRPRFQFLMAFTGELLLMKSFVLPGAGCREDCARAQTMRNLQYKTGNWEHQRKQLCPEGWGLRVSTTLRRAAGGYKEWWDQARKPASPGSSEQTCTAAGSNVWSTSILQSLKKHSWEGLKLLEERIYRWSCIS